MKIGLVAMSGIRVLDEELLRLGLTLPGFVERSQVIASLPSLGLLILAGMTPDKHTVEYVEVPDVRELKELPGDWDLVAISSYSAQIKEAYELAQWYRKEGVPVVMGGPHVTHCPDEASQYCDAVVIGEGELSWLDVLRDAENGNLKKFYGSLDVSFDLANSPMPMFELLDLKKYNRLTVQASRGCPHRCEFCASSPLITRRYSQKPVDKVLAEIDRIRELWDGHIIEFVDDNAIVNKSYWKKLLKELKSRRIKWFAETDISVADDEEILELMRESGCVQVLIGLESPESSGLKNLELKGDWKYRKFETYKDAIKKIQSHGIRVTGCFILGLDSHGPDVFEDVIEFVRETEMFDVQITLLTPFPGTPLYERLKKEKRLMDETGWERCTLFDLNFYPRRMEPSELRNRFRDLGVTIYGDEFTKWRKDKFKEHLRGAIRRKREEK